MGENCELESFLAKAHNLEKKYDWIGAAKLYKKASRLTLEKRNFGKAANLYSYLGYCYGRAAFQSDSNRVFKARIKLSVEAYEKASELYEIDGDVESPEKNHVKAMAILARYWIESDFNRKNELAIKFWDSELEVLKTYEKSENLQKIGGTINHLLDFFRKVGIWIHAPNIEKEKMMNQALNLGEKAIEIFSTLSCEYELAQVYNSITAGYIGFLGHRSSQIERGISEETTKKCIEYAKKALELSQKTEDAWLISSANILSGFSTNTCKPGQPWINFFMDAIKYGEIANDNYLKATANLWISMYYDGAAIFQENPDNRRLFLEKALKSAEESISQYKIINFFTYVQLTYKSKIQSLVGLASIETDLNIKQILLRKAIDSGLECVLTHKSEDIWTLHALGRAYHQLAKISPQISERKKLLLDALSFIEKSWDGEQKSRFKVGGNNYTRGLILFDLAKIEIEKTKKISLLSEAISSFKKGSELRLNFGQQSGWLAKNYYWFGRTLDQLYSITKDETINKKAIEVYNEAIRIFNQRQLIIESAESYWQIAKLYDRLGKNLDSAKNYESAGQMFTNASAKIPQLKEFYNGHSLYMQAWSHIEKAKYNHQNEEYNQSKIHYQHTGQLLKSTRIWNYLAPNYLAWALVEDAETLSRKENTKDSKSKFQKAIEYFRKGEEAIRTKIPEIKTEEEKEMATKLQKTSKLKRRYCEARILLEEAKIFERNGKYNQSSTSYDAASEKFRKMITEVETKETRQEIQLIMTLCNAWKKMALAEKNASPETYEEAAKYFEQAKNFSATKRTSLLALGNSSFCLGLAVGTRFQSTSDKKLHSIAKIHMKNAATFYLKAGFQIASEHANATQRLFDAYVFMNDAEMETDPKKSAKFYRMAEKVLLISAASFTKARQTEKRAEVERILKKVKEEKELAISLSQVLETPEITSTTYSFTTPKQTNGEAVGLEFFEHANIQANLVTYANEVKVGESFCLSIEFVNAGKEPALLTRVEDFIPTNFIVVKKPEIYRIEESTLNMKGKQITPLKLVEVKLTLQASKKGGYRLAPKVHYLDELGHNKSLQLKSLEIKVEEVLLEDRVSTGTQELDSLLLGGIPNEYAVILTSSPSDERQRLVRNFLEMGTNENETIFHVSPEADGLEHLLENPNFILFLCNPKPKTKVKNLSNVYKLRSKTDLTNLSISLAKAYRNIDQSKNKRICVETISDVLVDYGIKPTRKWISELITDLGDKGFTMLAVMNSTMHPSDQVNAILDLFDGEITITQSDDPLDCKKSILVKKLRNQDYIKNPICLT